MTTVAVTADGYPKWEKHPAAIKDYALNWTDWLAGDTIATSVWTAPTGISLSSQSNTVNTSTVWISGGIPDRAFNIICTITTAGGRTEIQPIEIKIKKI